MAKRTYKFRLYPSKQHIEVLNEMLEICRNVYNNQLENKIIWYQDKGQNLSYQDLNSILLDLRVLNPNIEKLQIKNMVKNHYLAKSINDVSWNKFIQYLAYKAEDAGGKVCFVPAINTSIKCSNCGNMISKSLGIRIHKCSCGFVVHRDHNSAINILHSSSEIPKELRESTPVEMFQQECLSKQEAITSTS